jgi:transcriptional regulator with XRE-family HTH domain
MSTGLNIGKVKLNSMTEYAGLSFGQLLKAYLLKKGLRQNSLAAGIDVDRTYIARICNDQRRPDRTLTLRIIRYLYDSGALEYEDEATELLEAAGHAKFKPDDCEQAKLHLDDTQLKLRIKETTIAHDRQSDRVSELLPSLPATFPVHIQRTKLFTQIGSLSQVVQPNAILYGLMITTIIVGFLIWRSIMSQPAWREDFDPIRKRWTEASALWEDIEGASAVLKENNPNSDFGKVESEVIGVDVNTYPLLRVDVEAVGQNASYTVQILDKRTDCQPNCEKTVLQGISYPGERVVNLAQEMNWQGLQRFTINLWISGEGKSATFKLIAIENE